MLKGSVLFAVVCLAGCASGSSIVVGETRPGIEDWESVTITNEVPEGAKTIALVKASSDTGWTKQGSVDYAVEEIKRQAAKVGANTVVVRAQPAQTSVTRIPSDGGATSVIIIYPIEMEVVEGTAFYVER